MSQKFASQFPNKYFLKTQLYPNKISIYTLFPVRPHGTDMVHQLLVLHEAAAAEVTGAGGAGDARGRGGAGRRQGAGPAPSPANIMLEVR